MAGISEGVVLRGLLSDTQYQLTVTAIYSGDKKFRSRIITFRTLGDTDGSGELSTFEKFSIYFQPHFK